MLDNQELDPFDQWAQSVGLQPGPTANGAGLTNIQTGGSPLQTPIAGGTVLQPGVNPETAAATSTGSYTGPKDIKAIINWWKQSHPATAAIDMPGLVKLLNAQGFQATQATHAGGQLSDDKFVLNGQDWDLGSSFGSAQGRWFDDYGPSAGGSDVGGTVGSLLEPYTGQAPADLNLPEFQAPAPFVSPTFQGPAPFAPQQSQVLPSYHGQQYRTGTSSTVGSLIASPAASTTGSVALGGGGGTPGTVDSSTGATTQPVSGTDIAPGPMADNPGTGSGGSGGGAMFDYPDFTAPTGQQALDADPGYAFRVGQGSKALEASAAARGVLNTGGTLKDVLNYGQQAASQEYAGAYDRALGGYRTNRSNASDIYNTNYGNLASAYGMNFNTAKSVFDTNTQNLQHDYDTNFGVGTSTYGLNTAARTANWEALYKKYLDDAARYRQRQQDTYSYLSGQQQYGAV